MEVFTYDEQQLVAIFHTGSREGTISVLEKMGTELKADETELREMTDAAGTMLRAMTDAEFEALELIPDFSESDE